MAHCDNSWAIFSLTAVVLLFQRQTFPILATTAFQHIFFRSFSLNQKKCCFFAWTNIEWFLMKFKCRRKTIAHHAVLWITSDKTNDANAFCNYSNCTEMLSHYLAYACTVRNGRKWMTLVTVYCVSFQWRQLQWKCKKKKAAHYRFYHFN